MTQQLSLELLDLMEYEKVIEQGLGTFVEVGCALLAIRDGRKYRHAGYTTFEDYCAKRWSISRPHGYRLIDGAQAAIDVSPVGDIAPRSERQVRPLTRIIDAEARREAWKLALKAADPDEPTGDHVAAAVRDVAGPSTVPKPASAPGVPPHPATYPVAVLDAFRDLLGIHGAHTVLDPFAGVGTIHDLRPDYETTGVELESEWASAHPDTIIGNSTNLTDFFTHRFDAVCTSPAYGNRLADQYEAFDPQARRTYAIDLGRQLTDGNSGAMHFGRGDAYERLHRQVWQQCWHVLRDDGLLLLNCKDFTRDRRVMPVTGWHVGCLADLGFQAVDLRTIPVAGLPMAGALPLSELVIAFRKVEHEP